MDFDRERRWDYENGFYLTSGIERMGKLLAHYELYTSITALPGEVIELGVYKAASLVRWASFRNICESESSRKVVGFDAFGAFPREGVESDSDQHFIESFEGAGGPGLARHEVEAYLEQKNLRNIELVEGDVTVTVPEWIASRPATRIALLHLDMDVYEPTRFALEHLADRVVPGGLIVVDDFGAVEGATRAVEEWVSATGKRVESTSFNAVPAFVRV